VVTVWHLLSIKQVQGHIVTDDMSLKSVASTFERLAHAHLEEKYKNDPTNLAIGKAIVSGHNSLMNRITEAAPKRNLAIHGYWFNYQAQAGANFDPLVVRTTKKPKDGSPPKAQDAKWLDDLALEFCQIRNDLNAFSMVWLDPGAHDVGNHPFEPPQT